MGIGGGRESGSLAEAEGRISLRKCKLDSGGYDSRGSYWGLGLPLYRAEDEYGGYSAYIRARSREQAADLLGISPSRLKASKKRSARDARREALRKRYQRYIDAKEAPFRAANPYAGPVDPNYDYRGSGLRHEAILRHRAQRYTRTRSRR